MLLKRQFVWCCYSDEEAFLTAWLLCFSEYFFQELNPFTASIENHRLNLNIQSISDTDRGEGLVYPHKTHSPRKPVP